VGKVINRKERAGQLSLALITVFICLGFGMGCTMPLGTKRYPLSGGTVTVQGDNIYEDGKLFAELRYVSVRLNPNSSKASILGFGIYYTHYDKEIWICPEKGWRVIKEDGREYTDIRSVNKLWNEYTEEDYKYSAGARKDPPPFVYHFYGEDTEPAARKAPVVPRGKARISKDGKYVYYGCGRLFYAHKYLVEYGISKLRFPPF
jgi:hypothetical protein